MAVAVIDIGKTNAKVALVDLDLLTETEVRRTANIVLTDGPYPHFDEARLWEFILDSLANLGRLAAVEAISITAHGATSALLDAAGDLALPILDYEHEGIEATRDAYEAVRPPFADTGTPRLANGLNLGAQLFWQQRMFPDAFARATSILMYPQYWSFRLTGERASEVTSLGCHTDLWSVHRGAFSPMVEALGWRALFPPLRQASDVLGSLLPELAARTGLAANTPVHVGIHDSNASLLPHLMTRQAPFSVLSTGTWVIALAVGARPVALDPARDTLINVDAFGHPVASSRFMGGRENALLGDGLPAPTAAELAAVVSREVMYLPAAQQGSGPFPHATGRWTAEPATPGERRAAVSLYLALMASTCLELIGADGPTIVEGPFAANPEFTAMLRIATGREVIAEAAGTGTSVGAALLAGTVGGAKAPSPGLRPTSPPKEEVITARASSVPSPRRGEGQGEGAFLAYAKTWRHLAAS